MEVYCVMMTRMITQWRRLNAVEMSDEKRTKATVISELNK